MAAVETLEVLAPGPLTTVQDRGRFSYGRYGVAPSGALDSFSLRVANLLVGNDENEACLEITLFGLKLKILRDVTVAVAGADLHAYCDDTPLDVWTSCALEKGTILSFKGAKSGCRAYLAIGGGISVPQVLGSKSTNLPSRFGGLEGRPLKKGDTLCSNSPQPHIEAGGRRLPQTLVPSYGNETHLRVVFGPQDSEFTEKGKKAFLSFPYRVSPDSDRTGIRLAGPIIERRSDVGESIISEGVIAGTIQVPGDGQPIIILVEIVTGGYRKIATVITADLPLLGQIKPGDEVRFQEISLDEAYEAFRRTEQRLKEFREGVSARP
jgi:antagonist of KipI